MRQLVADATGFFEALHKNYGDIVYYEVPAGKYCAIFSSDLAAQALRDKKTVLALTDPSTPFDAIKWPNLVKTTGEQHRRLTALMVSAFAEDRMATYAEMLAGEVTRAIRRASDSSHPGDDVFSHFVRATQAGTVDWSFKNEREIRDAVYSILFPGYEPAITVLVYGIYYLHRNPAVRDRLEQEADQVLADRPMRGSDFAKLPYA